MVSCWFFFLFLSFLLSFVCLFVFFFVLCESFPCYGILGDWKFCFSFFAKKRFCLSGYLCNFTIRFWMYAEATCEIPRRVTRQRGTQIIYVFFQIDPNVYELLLEIGHCVRLCQPRHKWVFCKNSSRQSSIELSCDQIKPVHHLQSSILAGVFKLWKKIERISAKQIQNFFDLLAEHLEENEIIIPLWKRKLRSKTEASVLSLHVSAIRLCSRRKITSHALKQQFTSF